MSASAGLYPHLSVREMLLFFADLYGCDESQTGPELAKLAHLLGLTVTAEGVETQAQATILSGLGCDAGQGTYFSSAADPADVGRLLAPI